MARRTVDISIEDRSQTFNFRIKEMSATQLESWIMRALLLLAGSGMEIPDGANIKQAGGFLAERGIKALGALDYEKAKPLLDELLGCCYRVIDKMEERCTPETVDGYLEDVTSLFKLRMEAIKLNLGFLKAELEKTSACQEKAVTVQL